MSAFKAVSLHIRDAIIELLQDITFDAGSGAEAAFGLVTNDPAAEFDQEPYCLVYPGKLDTKKAAVGLQDRDVYFAIFIELTLETKNRTQAQTYDYMYNLSELVLNALDVGDFTGVLNTEDSTIVNWILNASRSTMKPAKTKAGAVLLCQIDACVSYSMDL